ncbi:uncharacterized protein LOC124999918 [Mugil cephalus]|uniref:uncharacterized protein LOC124999918 n=1 Tax=Mugil cephalus TaxID=48193 RepID=UPI001FB6887D|nr:uncharacterized protein LOC124999918 [Mugil cephalus]
MDNSSESKRNGRQWTLGRLVLLLFLAGLQPGLCSEVDQAQLASDNELHVAIIGPAYVTVGVPSSVECDASCTECTYSMSMDGQMAQGNGNELFFTVSTWSEALTVSCTVRDELNHRTSTATKKIQVLAGPANVTITGPDVLNPSASNTYTCNAYCRPSCNYTWKTDQGPWIGGHGNILSISPKETDKLKAVTCKATNTVSGLFVSTTRNVAIITGPSKVHIAGASIVQIAQHYKYMCIAECQPSCRYVLSMGSQSVIGNVIELTVDHPLETITLKCEAQNIASRKTATALKTVQLQGAGGVYNLSTRPQETSAVLLLAFIISNAFTL